MAVVTRSVVAEAPDPAAATVPGPGEAVAAADDVAADDAATDGEVADDAGGVADAADVDAAVATADGRPEAPAAFPCLAAARRESEVLAGGPADPPATAAAVHDYLHGWRCHCQGHRPACGADPKDSAAGIDAEDTGSEVAVVALLRPRGSASGADRAGSCLVAVDAVVAARLPAAVDLRRGIACRVAVDPAPAVTDRTRQGTADAASNSRASVVNTAATAVVAVDRGTSAAAHPGACHPVPGRPSCRGHRACGAHAAAASGSLGRPSLLPLLPVPPGTSEVALRLRTPVEAAAGRTPTEVGWVRRLARGDPVVAPADLVIDCRALDCYCFRRADSEPADLELASDYWMDEAASEHFAGLLPAT